MQRTVGRKISTLWLAGLAALLACGCGDGFDLVVERSEVVPTVATVRWDVEAGEVEETWIEFGPDSGYGRRAPARLRPDGRYAARLLGLKPDSEVSFRAMARTADGEVIGREHAVTTGPAPVFLPDSRVERPDPDASSGGFMVTTLMAMHPSAVILDEDGDYVWWWVLEDDQFSSTRARLAHDGHSMLYRYHGVDGAPGGVMRVHLDGSVSVDTTIEEEHHDFAELPDDTLVLIRRDRRVVDGREVVGDRIVERDRKGNETEVWTLWDQLEFDPAFHDPDDWAHANAIDHDPVEDVYYLSARNLDTIYKIDRLTGDTLWQLGGMHSDFVQPGGNTHLFDGQHQFHVDGDRVLIFDNGSTEDYVSRVVEYALDEENGTAELLRQWTSDPPLYVYALGDVTRLPNDNVLITWSTAGRIDEFTVDGDLVKRVDMQMGGALGFVSWHESLVFLP